MLMMSVAYTTTTNIILMTVAYIILITLVTKSINGVGVYLDAHAQFCPNYEYFDAVYIVNNGGAK